MIRHSPNWLSNFSAGEHVKKRRKDQLHRKVGVNGVSPTKEIYDNLTTSHPTVVPFPPLSPQQLRYRSHSVLISITYGYAVFYSRHWVKRNVG